MPVYGYKYVKGEVHAACTIKMVAMFPLEATISDPLENSDRFSLFLTQTLW